jgi:hypothetical protein
VPIPFLRRRIGALETTFAGWRPTVPLTSAEVVDIERRVRLGDRFTKAELERIERQSPIVEGSMLMSCRRGQLYVKRYLGIDLSDV